MRCSALLSLAALAAGSTASLAPPASAQERPRTFEGTLGPCSNGHRVSLRADRRYVITADSEAFDPVLRLYRRGDDTVLAEDDDGGEGNNSRLAFTARETGNYLICVASFGAGGTGAYTVGLEPMGAAPPLPAPITEPTRTETAVRRIFEGSLDESDGEDENRRFDDYQISLQPGEAASINLESEAFDTLLKIYRADDRGGEEVASDDDSGGELDSFLRFAPAEGGTFIVRVTTYGAGTGGAYRLRIE